MTITTAYEIAAYLGLPLHGANIPIARAATLDSVSPHSVVFVKKNDPALLENIKNHRDILVLLQEGVNIDGVSAIYCSNPRFEFARVLERFFAKPRSTELIADTAVIDATATLGTNVRIGHYSVIGPHVVIGDNTEIRHHVVIATGVQIGESCLIKSNTVIGEEGFGFEKDETGAHIRIPHIGSVVIGDNVEIGALTSICCGTVDSTIIGEGTKIDDHVFIAHNVKTGKNCVIIAASEVSGSVKLGSDVWLAPGVTVINGVEVGDKALLGTGAIITKSVEPKAVMGGARAVFLRYAEN